VELTMTWNWGVGIAVAYSLFAASTLGFVAFAMSRPVELVSRDYYARSLRHDERLQAEAHVRALGSSFAAALAEDGRTVLLSLPAAHAASASGSITLYRPSDAAADRVVALAVDGSGRQRVPLPESGRWVLKMQWTDHDRAYYHEQTVVAR
jgi:hypothetical protein